MGTTHKYFSGDDFINAVFLLSIYFVTVLGFTRFSNHVNLVYSIINVDIKMLCSSSYRHPQVPGPTLKSD